MSASESSTLQPNTPVPTGQQSTKIPLLGEGFQESAGHPVSKSNEGSDVELENTGDSGKHSRRRLFGFGKKKKDEEKSKSRKNDDIVTPGDFPMVQSTAEKSGVQSPPSRSPNHPYQSPASPQRNLYSSSPRLVSPAGSQIFERDVQESSLPVPNSPAIPSHIQQENHIPAVLDASSEAITNKSLSPDTVEIVMHSSHQPAAISVTGLGGSEHHVGQMTDELVAHPEKEDTASNYGALDSADIRRLSFISFQDIVQSEHMEHAGSRDSLYIAGLSSISSGGHRSPSPVRSPVSSPGLGTSPPTSKSASVKGVELSPRTKALAGPALAQTNSSGGELTIETMSQALRRTGSGDLSGFRSPLASPSSPEGLSDTSLR